MTPGQEAPFLRLWTWNVNDVDAWRLSDHCRIAIEFAT
jgi:hypothetical protein